MARTTTKWPLAHKSHDHGRGNSGDRLHCHIHDIGHGLRATSAIAVNTQERPCLVRATAPLRLPLLLWWWEGVGREGCKQDVSMASSSCQNNTTIKSTHLPLPGCGSSTSGNGPAVADNVCCYIGLKTEYVDKDGVWVRSHLPFMRNRCVEAPFFIQINDHPQTLLVWSFVS